MKIMYGSRSINKGFAKEPYAITGPFEAEKLLHRDWDPELFDSFVATLSRDKWELIPDELIGYTMAQNFYNYAKLVEE